MSDGNENQLGKAASGYLRSAQHQPIAWNEWGAEAFGKAKAQNKPVLLDIGAVWCHWCHVMDRESYENADTAHVINEFYIAVKVDRDERPDVDARYQAAVSAISGQGGWPLTVFLTSDGKPYFGGTYFPPEERYGRPSFQRVLMTMADAFVNKRDEVEDSAGSVMAAIEYNETFAEEAHGETSLKLAGQAGAELVEKLVGSACGQFDELNGGFGAQPKFPHAGALDLLLDAAGRGDETARKVTRFTLEKMAAGGIYDQLAGGFHRYSVDEKWVVPHFEKMAYDNSELLKNYAHAFQAFAEPEDARVANDILRWMDEWLSDRELGGFYASQDADDSLEDDGDYFTWTRDEAAAVLSADEFAAAALYFNLRAVGDMHHNPEKCVLHRTVTVAAIALRLQRAVEEVRALLAAAEEKMYGARLRRRTPYVDKTVYTGWNGMCIAGYLAAGRALGLKAPVEFALKSMDRLLEAAWDPATGLGHVVAYGEEVAPGSRMELGSRVELGSRLELGSRVAGVLEDYGFVGNACVDAWEATGEFKYYVAAKGICDAMLARFCDLDAEVCRGFFDTESRPDAIGALRAKRKPLQDSPTPSGNALAATLLLRLHALAGEERYRRRGMETLATFAGIVEHFGLYAASFGLALRRAVEAPIQVCVIGDDDLADDLAATAMAGFAVNKSVIRLQAGQMQALPPALAETLPHLEVEGSVAVVCRGMTCLPPVTSVDALIGLLAV